MFAFFDRLRKFYGSIYYPIFIALLVFLGHVSGFDVACILVATLAAVPGLLLMHDVGFFLPNILYFVFVVTARGYDPATSDYSQYLSPSVLIPASITAFFVLGGLAVFLVRNRRIANRIPQGPLTLSLFFLAVAFLCNGFFNPAYVFPDFLYALTLVFATLCIYLLFSCYSQADEDGAERLLKLCVIGGMLILAELTVAFFTVVRFENGSVVKESVTTGWGVWTTVGGMLAFLMPASFYFAATARRSWIGWACALAEYLGTLLSQSRGAFLIGSVIFVLCLIAVCTVGQNKKKNRLVSLLLAAVGLIGCLLLFKKLMPLVSNFVSYGFADNGRFELWQIGLRHFLAHPIFGSGFYDSYVSEWNTVVYPYLYHNTIVQMLGACGIVGLLAYLFHRVVTVRQILRLPNPQSIFLGLCILGLLGISFLDVLFFKTYPTLFYGAMLVYLNREK